MSKDVALAFLKMAMEKEDLQKKVLALAKEEGYEFSVDEITDDDLAEVAGGVLRVQYPTSIGLKWDTPIITKTILP